MAFNFDLSFISTLMTMFKVAPEIKKYIDLGLPILQTLQSGGGLKDVIPVLEQIGGQLFPALKDPIKIVAAAADALFDPQGTEWVQRSLNKLQAAGLDEDGNYGKLTKAAVEKFQQAHQPAAGPVDGWAGPKTNAVIVSELAKLSAKQ